MSRGWVGVGFRCDTPTECWSWCQVSIEILDGIAKLLAANVAHLAYIGSTIGCMLMWWCGLKALGTRDPTFAAFVREASLVLGILRDAERTFRTAQRQIPDAL